MLLVFVVLTLFILGAYLFLAYTCFFTKLTCITSYRLAYEKVKSHEQAVRFAFDVFKDRPPFDTLTLEQYNRAVKALSSIPDITAIAEIIRITDKIKNVSSLQNEGFLKQFEKISGTH